ncbi:KPN_02809 family neutral zinc metallopeptidase [Serinibacter arcticus]|uniref:YpfJ protein, zinc metalloprotease superfamily n=1 Tax=Serinibacter arcticus TaxID=1655435 RepID=A0A4Z1E054_9MICO|nr:neutral zinc metallopeptidase [Serinibacter arcticus]TGO04438.1 YpfJ protein, zinc metalloprotease superfamily [Serinibacter arcticus]
MTFNKDADISGNRVRRGGGRRGVAVGGGIGGLGLIVVLLFQVFTGQNVDLSGLTGEGQGQYQPEQGEDSYVQCLEGGDQANREIDCRMNATALSLDQYWEETLPAQSGVQYQLPEFLLFTGNVSTGCGAATSAVGPFYCPPDSTVYIDTTFFDELTSRFGADGGPLGELYVVAHEFGHHIQNQLGTMNAIDRTGTGPTSDAVRLELQADCYAGMWVQGAVDAKDADGNSYLLAPTDAEIDQALSAAAAVGDDHIQETFSGEVTPHTWTHGSSEQRKAWFETGRTQGTLQACDTFAVGDAL